MDYPDPDFSKDDDVLMQYLEEEGLALVPIEFMRELMLLMEAHIVQVCSIDRDELNDIMIRMEEHSLARARARAPSLSHTQTHTRA